MSQRKTIQYALDPKTGQVWSRVWSELAIPILQYEKMGPHNNFEMEYELEKRGIFEVSEREHGRLIWTKKIPMDIKNQHRKFWDMKELKKAS